MMVVMKAHSTPDEVQQVVRLLEQMGAHCEIVRGAARQVIELLEVDGSVDKERVEQAPMVDQVLERPLPILAADRRPGQPTREVPLSSTATIGGRVLAVIAGPCSVESEDALLETACCVADAGAVALRGGVFKPRTSPYSFQGLEERGLEILARVRDATGLAIVSEVLSPEHVRLVAPCADVLQVGSRNMHNTPLLRAVGQQPKPILLKRGWSATLEEFLLAAEYVMHAGNEQVILCERGIRTHEEYVRNTLALSVVPEIKRISRLPVVVDPSHGTGRSHLVSPMSKAAIACGADGLLIEVHPNPRKAWTDGPQALDLDQFRKMITELEPYAVATGRQTRSVERGNPDR